MTVLLRLVLFTLLLGSHTVASAQLNDDFSDGDFTNNPTWSGDNVKFEVDLSNQLHLNAPSAIDEAYLTTPSNAISNGVWEFYVELDFNPSSSNKADIYLISSAANLYDPLNGYFVRIGTTQDEISLYRNDGSSSVKIIDGPDDRVDYSPVTVRVRVTRDIAGNWEVLSDTLGGTNYVSEGTVFDDTYTQSSYFGVFCDYTSTRSDKFYFDDIVVTGQAFMDTIPPDVVSVNVLSDTTLDIQFSEFLDVASAETEANYSVDLGIGIPSSAILDNVDSTLVHLTFSNSFNNGTTHILTVSQVSDTAGNAIPSIDESFFYFSPVLATFRDIVINEIMADHSPTNGLPETEFLEISNISNSPFDLIGWQLSDISSSISLPSHLILPGDFIILCAQGDTALFSSFGTVIGLSSLPTLNNDFDSLSLHDPAGKLIDLVPYTDEWYNDESKSDGGWTLELINPNHPCSGKDNWHASIDPIGGTPGQVNSVFDPTPDTQAPEVSSFDVTSSTEILIVFNEGMDSASLANAGYQLDNGISVTNVAITSPGFSSVALTLSPALDAAVIYSLTLNGPADCSGNPLAAFQTTISLGAPPDPFNIIINELYTDPDPELSSLPDAEFIELFNASDRVIRLEDAEICDAGGCASIPEQLMFPGDYIILTGTSSEAEYSTYGTAVGVPSMVSLNNSGDQILLRDANGTIIDQVNYLDSWLEDEEGKTLERVNPDDVCGTASNWRASAKSDGGTPGAENSVFDSLSGQQEIGIESICLAAPNQLEVQFNQKMDSASLTQNNYTLSPSISFDSILPDAPEFSSVTLELLNSVDRGKVYTVSINQLINCKGDTQSTAISDQFVYADSLGLVVNEILFNPRGSGTDFVELYNRSPYSIDLKNWSLGYLDSDDSLRFNTIASVTYELPAGGYVLLNEDGDNVLLEYPNAIEETFLDMNLPSYSNNSGQVLLYNNFQEQIDRFDYSDDLHFTLLRDEEGVSLERIDPERKSNDFTNWHSASEQVGFATPGFQNSQFGQASIDENNISLTPEVFSPDNDGVDDVLNINYQFDQPGFVGNITIYDARGRLVRTLVNNELLDIKGTISWDGTGDTGEKARIGIHIVFVEVFDLNGNVMPFKETCVVAGRL